MKSFYIQRFVIWGGKGWRKKSKHADASPIQSYQNLLGEVPTDLIPTDLNWPQPVPPKSYPGE